MRHKTPFQLSSTGVLAASLDDVGSFILEPDRDSGTNTGATCVALELQNASASAALADFALLGKTHSNGSWHTLISGATWATVAGILQHKVGALNTLAAASRAFALVNLGPLYAVKFQAQSAAATILTNGTFTGNANSWTLASGAAYGTNNVACTTLTGTIKQLLAAFASGWTSGLIYEIQFTISSYSAGSLVVGTNTDTDQGGDAIVANGTYTRLVTADAHANGLVFTGTGFTGIIDTITAKLTVPVSVRGMFFN